MSIKKENNYSSNIIIKLNEYKDICDFSDIDYKKFFKSNMKFIEGSVRVMLKRKEPEVDIIKFLNDCINFHKETYKVLLMTTEQYGEYMSSKAIY